MTSEMEEEGRAENSARPAILNLKTRRSREGPGDEVGSTPAYLPIPRWPTLPPKTYEGRLRVPSQLGFVKI